MLWCDLFLFISLTVGIFNLQVNPYPSKPHLLLPFFQILDIYLSDIFLPQIMFIISLQILQIVFLLSGKYHLFWSCFGWVKKWLKIEFNSNLYYFSTSKNCEDNLFEEHLFPVVEGCIYISHIPSPTL